MAAQTKFLGQPLAGVKAFLLVLIAVAVIIISSPLSDPGRPLLPMPEPEPPQLDPVVLKEDLEALKTNRKSRPDLTFDLACKWGPLFDAPVDTIMAVVATESEHNPAKINLLRSEKGGAWGLGQQMADETDYKIKILRRRYLHEASPALNLQRVIARWKGSPQDLLDPELNMVLTAWQIGRLHRVFDGDFETVVAAYHQGEPAIKLRLQAGKPAIGKRQPRGMLYVSVVLSARARYLDTSLPRFEKDVLQ
jgi:hypothetical protein